MLILQPSVFDLASPLATPVIRRNTLNLGTIDAKTPYANYANLRQDPDRKGPDANPLLRPFRSRLNVNIRRQPYRQRQPSRTLTPPDTPTPNYANNASFNSER